MPRHIALALCLVACAIAKAAPTPADRVKELFDAMRIDDRAALQSIYSDRAWKLLHPTGGDEGGGDIAAMLQQRMTAVQSVDVIDTKETGDTAVVTIKIKQQPADETAHLFFRKQADAWRLDYARDDAEAPFCLDEMGCAYLVWMIAHEKAEKIADPVLWYADVLHGTRRAEAIAASRPESLMAQYMVGGLYFDLLSHARHRDFAIEATRKTVRDAKPFPHLAAYDFPYGVPPQAIAFHYYKAATLLETSAQRETAPAPMIVDSRPALALESWAMHELEWGRAREADTAKDRATLAEAIFSYDRAARLCDDATAEYARHVKKYPENNATYRGHVLELSAVGPEATADAAWLRSQTVDDPERERFRASAKANYVKSLDAYKALTALYDDPEDLAEFRAHTDRAEARLRQL